MKSAKKRGKMGVYSSLVKQKKQPGEDDEMKEQTKSEKRLRPLPEEPVKRFFAHFRWERIRAYWFSLAGLKRIGKIFLACVLLGIIAVGALFVYYKNQLKEIQLNDLTIAETVNTYLDRNGVVLWEDKGDADYRLVVDGDKISTYVRQATVAIEDRNFYSHPGIDIGGLIRATISTLTKRGVQGGSTLTQQLIKQVYFADEAASENRGGLSRKIKELILAIELEKMYSKEQIITMYLNESPYGGRRNGIESAAQTYFGKSAAELTLAESALLASIPNNPGLLNPYNEYGHEDLLARQRKTLDVMAELGYITAEEAAEAKEVPILDQVLPESSQYTNMKAPHFVMEVKRQLEEKYPDMLRKGGYTITTTLDYRAQEFAEAAVAAGDAIRYVNASDNIAMVSLDVETSQVIAMVGSINWETPVYGEVNATTSLLEPGSTIKPILDYAPLFSQKEGRVWGPGSILKDEDISSFYCQGYTGGSCGLANAVGKFFGDITIRDSLANSLNVGAVKALAIVGIENGLEIAHDLGDKSYCVGSEAGLSMAIGSGCGVKMVEHANAYASLARGGSYKDLAYVLEVKDPSGRVIESWHDMAAVRVIDEQVAYELASILSDAAARAKFTFGAGAYQPGWVVNGVWTASKTGTTTTANSGVTKDSWMMSYSTAVVTAVWNGNHDGSGLTSSTNNVVRAVVDSYMGKVHHELYAQEGKWKSGDQPVKPAGIKDLTVAGKADIWPSWYTEQKSGLVKEKVEFNKNNGLKAADCTPKSLRVEVEISKIVDPISKKETMVAGDEKYKLDETDACTGSGADDNIISIKPVKVGSRVTRVDIEFTPETGMELNNYIVYMDDRVVDSGTVTSYVLRTGLSQRVDTTNKTIEVIVSDSQGEKYSVVYSLE